MDSSRLQNLGFRCYSQELHLSRFRRVPSPAGVASHSLRSPLYSSDSVLCAYLNLSNGKCDYCHSLNESLMSFLWLFSFRGFIHIEKSSLSGGKPRPSPHCLPPPEGQGAPGVDGRCSSSSQSRIFLSVHLRRDTCLCSIKKSREHRTKLTSKTRVCP